MPLVKLPENTIITSLYCPRCEGVGRLYRKTSGEAPETLKGAEKAEYFYTLRCPQCGEIELFGRVDQRSS
jgi:phage FluMu protein Com